MDDLRISTVQFENRSGDKDFNLSVIEKLVRRASREGSRLVAFHECSVCGYSFARKLNSQQFIDLAERVPDGPSVSRLIKIARKHNIKILSGLFERDDSGRVFKTQVCVGPEGLIAKHRKLHPFIHPDIVAGDSYTVFEIDGWKCGILICYDNNIIENVRATRLLGAEIIFMPHVTMCTPSPRPGSGFVDPQLWFDRKSRKRELRSEFDGPKGREWLMKWLPSRACDNSVYVVFSNAIGMDDDQLKNGCSMILDPFGDIMTECRKLGNDMVSATLTREKLSQGGGYRYLKARKPELYRDIIGMDNEPEQKVAWM